MDPPSYCSFCGTEYRSTLCPYCVTMARYRAKLTNCFMCQTQDPSTRLFIRIMDGLEDEMIRISREVSYDAVVRKDQLKGKRRSIAEDFSTDHRQLALDSYLPDSFESHTTVLCEKCLAEKTKLLQNQYPNPESVTKWSHEWKELKYPNW